MTECLCAGLYVATGGNARHFDCVNVMQRTEHRFSIAFEGKMIDAADPARQVISFWTGGQQRKP